MVRRKAGDGGELPERNVIAEVPVDEIESGVDPPRVFLLRAWLAHFLRATLHITSPVKAADFSRA